MVWVVVGILFGLVIILPLMHIVLMKKSIWYRRNAARGQMANQTLVDSTVRGSKVDLDHTMAQVGALMAQVGYTPNPIQPGLYTYSLTKGKLNLVAAIHVLETPRGYDFDLNVPLKIEEEVVGVLLNA
jgi:hypothetical protein